MSRPVTVFMVEAKGYTPHDGGPMPAELTPATYPAVLFEDGSFLRQGSTRAEKIDWSRVRGWKLRDYRVEQPGNNFRGDKLRQMAEKLKGRDT